MEEIIFSAAKYGYFSLIKKIYEKLCSNISKDSENVTESEYVDYESVDYYLSEFKYPNNTYVGVVPLYEQSPYFMAAIYGNLITFSNMTQTDVTSNRISWMPKSAYLLSPEEYDELDDTEKAQNFHILHILVLFRHKNFLKSIIEPYYTILCNDGVVQPYWYDIIFGPNTVSPLENDPLIDVITKENFFLSWMAKNYPGRNMERHPVTPEEFQTTYREPFQQYLARCGRYEWNALHWSAACGKTHLLTEVIDDIKTIDNNKDSIININTPAKGGFTPLILACIANHLSYVKILLGKGAALTSTEENISPLHAATAHNNPKCLNLLLEFITHKQSESPESGIMNLINSQDKNGKTALHYACEMNSPECVKLLLQYDKESININIIDNQGKTALALAQQSNNVECAKFLTAKMPKIETTTPTAHI